MDDPTIDDNEAFGRAATARRAELGLTRKDVATRSGLSYPFLADIESGRKRPSAKALQALAAALQVRPSELLDRAEAIARGGRPGPEPGAGSERERRNWFEGGTHALASMRGPLPHDEMRSLVREVVREELQLDGPVLADTLPASPAQVPEPAAVAFASPAQVPELAAGIRAQLPKWLRTPATSATDLAIQALVLERLHRLDPQATRAQVRDQIDASLDQVIERARSMRR